MMCLKRCIWVVPGPATWIDIRHRKGPTIYTCLWSHLIPDTPNMVYKGHREITSCPFYVTFLAKKPFTWPAVPYKGGCTGHGYTLYVVCTGLGKRVVPRLRELVPRGQSEGGIHATLGPLFCPALYVLTDASGGGPVGGRDFPHGEVLLERSVVPHVRHPGGRHRRLHPLVLLLLPHAS